jgi:hypothetical protein
MFAFGGTTSPSPSLTSHIWSMMSHFLGFYDVFLYLGIMLEANQAVDPISFL